MTELYITDEQAEDLYLILKMANESFDLSADNNGLQDTLNQILEALRIGKKK